MEKWFYGINEALEVKDEQLRGFKPTWKFQEDYRNLCAMLKVIPHPFISQISEIDGNLNFSGIYLDLANFKIFTFLLTEKIGPLKISNCGVDFQILSALAEKSNFLKNLTLEWVEPIDSPLPPGDAEIDDLEISRRKLDDNRRQKIAERQNPEEKSTDTVCAVFSPFFSENSALEILRLRSCNISSLWDISRWDLKTRKLQILDLWLNPLYDEGVNALVEKIAAVPTLEHLSLAKTRISDIGAVAALRTLGGCEVTAEEFEKMQKSKIKTSDIFRDGETGKIRHRAPQLKTLSLAFNEKIIKQETISGNAHFGYRAQLILHGCPAAKELQENAPYFSDDEFGWRIRI